MSPHQRAAANVRCKAEERLRSQTPAVQTPLSAPEIQRQFHELQVHQIELEMQNEELRESRAQEEAARARYSDLYDFAPVGYLTLDGQGMITQTNLAAARMLGLERARLRGKRLAAFIAPAYLPAFITFLLPAGENPVQPTCDVALAVAGQPLRIVNCTATRSADGHVVSIILVDITERKKLADHNAWMNALLTAQQEASVDGILLMNCKGGIISHNQHFVEMWRIPVDIIASKSAPRILQAVAGLHVDPVSFAAQISSLHHQSHEIAHDEIVLTDGRTLDRHSVPVVGNDGEYFGRAWFFRDVSEVKKAASELTAAKHLAESANQAKSEFLATMSHEIRTPLTGVIGLASLLLSSGLTPEQQEMMELLNTSGQSLLTVITDVLDMSKIEAGRIELERRPFDLPTLAETVRCMFTTCATEKGLDLVIQVDPTLPVCLLGDAPRLRQVLVNLVGNAVKFTDHGTVTLTAAPAGRRDGTDLVSFAVSDTGPGIPASYLPRLFQPFTQGDASLTRRHGGTGLGLTISRKLTELMGGTLQATNNPEIGCCFRLVLPLAAAAAEPPVQQPRPSATPSLPLDQQFRVLLVEDDPICQQAGRLMLENLGYLCQIVADGDAAVTALSADAYTLVLMDCHMPNSDGWYACTEIRRLGHRLPIIAVTANVQNKDQQRCRLAGMDDFLAKPFTYEQLERCLTRWSRTAAARLEQYVALTVAGVAEAVASE